MVCTPGHGKMAALARFLTFESPPSMIAEEIIHENIVIQTIQREFDNANEANLLEEQDMYVFDSCPLTDPLHLVRCNACKKPVKASQFASHAERCKSSNSQEDLIQEVGVTGRKKPPRKGRKNLLATSGKMTNSQHVKSESLKEDQVAVSKSSLEYRNGLPLNKSTFGEAKNLPVPLATKMYSSQRNNRLRIALGHLYHEASIEVSGNGSLSPESRKRKILKQKSELCVGMSSGLPVAISVTSQF